MRKPGPSSGRHAGGQLELDLSERPAPHELPAAKELEVLARHHLWEAGAEKLAARVTVRWSARLTTTAGLAYPHRDLIRLNPRLAAFGTAEIERTLLHELAHLLARERAGRRRIAPHGPEWRRACRDLGLPDEARCHDLPLPRRSVERRHIYRCPACAVEVRRVRPFRAAVACFACCKSRAGGKYDQRFRLVKVRA